MSKSRILLYLLLGCSTVFSFSCKKEDVNSDGLRMVKGVPHYHFTDSDKPWLSAQEGDIWKLENASGYQRIYKLWVIEQLQAKNQKFGSPGIPTAAPKLLNYYDSRVMRINRLDSALGAGEIRFYRDASLLSALNSGGSDKHKSQFYAEGEWYDFVGNTNLISDYFSCQGMKFPSGANLEGPFTQLTVRGRQYNEVVVFTATDRGATCKAVPSRFMQEMYYDRRAGIIKMVSKAGEVWERVP